MRLRQLVLAAAALGCANAAVAQTVACNMDLNVADQDPAGLNVRASPGGAILTAVKARNLWVQVHVTGQKSDPSGGAWARIDKATLIGDETDSPDKVLFKGVGWVAFSKLGVEEFDTRTRIRAAPNSDAKVLLSLEGWDDNALPTAEALLGCDGAWLKVRLKGAVGWTDNYCANQLTTCVYEVPSAMFLDAIQRKVEPDPDVFPWSLPVFRWLERLQFRAPVTFLVGENGSGKSTLLEGLAAGMDAVTAGGADIERDESLAAARRLAAGYRFSRKLKPRARLFVRAEDLFGFVRRVSRDMRDLADMEEGFRSSIKGDYGRQLATGAVRGQRSALSKTYGEDPDARSHGETFLNLLEKRLVVEGLYFLDEPEAPLSPLRILSLISLLKQVVADGSQLVICTHSPILMAFPGAEILLFEGDTLTPTPYEELDHVRLTRAFLNDPESYLRRL